MIIYQYDGSLDGYLTCLYEARTMGVDNALFTTDQYTYQISFDTELKSITSDLEKADTLIANLKKIIKGRGISDLYHAFESCDNQKDIIIFNYVMLAFKVGRDVTTMLSHPHVVLFNQIVKRVRNEIHKMSGFLRFVKTKSEIYYAAYSPENNITGFLMQEFRDRFPIMSCVLHDVMRGIIGIYNGQDSILVHDDKKASIEYADDEKYIEKLWQKYYATVNIKERYNRRQMLNYMPLKYVNNIHTWTDFEK